LNRTEDYARSEVLQDKRYLCGWLSSSQPPELLAASLAEQCNHVSDAFLPLFEPLCFELLQTTRAQNGMTGSIWPVSHWWYMTVAGELACQLGKEPVEQWRLNWGEEWAQQNVRAIGDILKIWGAVNVSLPSDAAIQAATMWKKMASTGLTDTRDSYFLAAYSLGIGVDIAQHPVVKNLIQQVIADPSLRLSQCLQTLPDTLKQDIKAVTGKNENKGAHHHDDESVC
uniref:hypothetical protein n=1 Tax=uncultured Cedecea sp. TaxID=988762 RepID=UPI00262352D7